MSPLHVVAEDGPIELIRLFHAFGADANVTDIVSIDFKLSLL